MQKIVIATKNPGKVREMAAALSALPFDVVSLAEFGELPDAIEDGKTFAENARIKAAFYQQQTGCACIADDSGMERQASIRLVSPASMPMMRPTMRRWLKSCSALVPANRQPITAVPSPSWMRMGRC